MYHQSLNLTVTTELVRNFEPFDSKNFMRNGSLPPIRLIQILRNYILKFHQFEYFFNLQT